MCPHKALPILLGAAVEPCPGTSWELEGCCKENHPIVCVYSPEHRTTCVFLTTPLPSTKLRVDHPYIRVYPCVSVPSPGVTGFLHFLDPPVTAP